MPGFDARCYWDGRLRSRWTLGGTGHLQYSAAYNRWLYRAKREGRNRLVAWSAPPQPKLAAE